MDDARAISQTDPGSDAAALVGHLAEILAGNERVALCTILRLTGSGPRGVGAKMLVRSGGPTVGTVGGGALELRAAAWAQDVLRTGRAICRSFTLKLLQASEEGMACGGEVELLVELLDGTRPAVREFFDETLSLLRRGGQGWMVTAISGSNDSPTAERSLIENGRRLASIPSPGRPVPTELFASAPSNPVLVSHGDIRYFLEPVAPPTTLYVFGGGHIALHLVPLCHRLGFRTVVVDDRVEFISRERFPEADERLAVSRFENALEDFRLGDTSYVVIVTRGHGGDLAVLRQALAHRPGFIGMIGSARKRALIFGQLTQEGVASDVLARVACPVGLPIGAETPEEIAVSIAAQLVAVRRGKA